MVRRQGERIFLVKDLADRQKFRPHSHKWNFKTWGNIGWKFKQFAFFLVKCDSTHWRCHIIPKNKKSLSRVFSSYKAHKLILDLIIVSNGEKWILKRVCNFRIWVKSSKKKIQNFGKDFSVKKKIEKKPKNQIFFEKKWFFDFFFF